MLTWLLDKLAKKMKVIKKSPISFGVACLIAAIIFGLLEYFIFSATISIQASIIQAYEKKGGVEPSTNLTNQLKHISEIETTKPAQWYLRIKSVEVVSKSTNDHPQSIPFRIIAQVNSQNYSFPGTQLCFTGDVSARGESVPLLAAGLGEYLVQFVRQDINQSFLRTAITNSFIPKPGSQTDSFQIKDLPAVGNNEVVIQDLRSGADTGITRIIYEIANH